MPRAVLVLFAAVLMPYAQLPAKAGDDLNCALSIHAMDATAQVAGPAVIAPDQVVTIERTADPATGNELWRVVLTPDGAADIRAHTGSPVGGRLAVVCGSGPVQAATIQGETAGEFV